MLWEDAKLIGKGEVFQVRNVEARLHIARKTRHHDEWDPPLAPYDCDGPGQPIGDK
jgi:hypothetical protein